MPPRRDPLHKTDGYTRGVYWSSRAKAPAPDIKSKQPRKGDNQSERSEQDQ